MRAVDDLPEEFQDPVLYDGRWLWIALAALAVVALYYAAVLWWSRARPEPPPPPPEVLDVPSQQRAHLERLDRLADDVRARRVTAREGHQRLSEVLRSYVEAVTPLKASTMGLSELRRRAPRELTDAVALMYPPEFAPGEEGRAADLFEDAFARARGLVSRWGSPGHAAASATAAPAPPPAPPSAAQPGPPPGAPGGGSWT